MQKLMITAYFWMLMSCAVHAGLVLNPQGGEQLFVAEFAAAKVGDAVDDVAELRQLGLSNFQLFGNPVSQMWVSDNGNLNSNNNVAYYPDRIGSTNPAIDMIAPLWDDVLLLKLPENGAPMNRVLENRLADVYYAVTWQNARVFNETVETAMFPATIRSVQAVLFGSSLLMDGFQFQRNDIVFSYVSFDGTTASFVDEAVEEKLPSGKSQLNAAIGVSSRTGDSQSMFGDTDNSGFFEADEAAATLPWTNQEFVLFREVLNGSNDFSHYNVSIERFVSVPEPSSFLVCLTGLLVACGTRLNRRTRKSSINKSSIGAS